MFEQFYAHCLEDIGGVGGPQAKLDGKGVDEAPVPLEQGLPRAGIAVEAHVHQFGIRAFFVRRGSHYRGFLDFQKLSNPKKIITRDDNKTIRKRPVPNSGLCTYFLYSLTAARM